MSSGRNVDPGPAIVSSSDAEDESSDHPASEVGTETGSSSCENYTIGYGKPPKAGQFKRGQSGNPRGRRKGAKTLKGALHAVMSERITVHTGKGPKRLTKIEAVVQRVTNGALSGDAAAARLLIAMIQSAGLQSDLGEALDIHQAARMMDEDRAILDRMLGHGTSAGCGAASHEGAPSLFVAGLEGGGSGHGSGRESARGSGTAPCDEDLVPGRGTTDDGG
ncbi:DUF5681 domain-containing protein [Aurantimonas sp. C2-6-R+9]|uniref:DUF5681 domain-containing protein n=1 Tax=unclassified Aurantimonas TaxID=2638230 RepID=UPI002E17A617|nr:MULTISPECIES: DUF5681 domain-containing protein [unclassified Aurantimonas]MEC5291824.1 DUF5681 domain-containing protein [Aurantimonas sp. C2-3-R2]MEC5382407.1 DUF5681 domain-containing protein [Aurantimonas sp. C2-6-R+9]MEC5412889.1 DUF5681 domain-containing protein [Aurantimonas sp. C2-4-R8]